MVVICADGRYHNPLIIFKGQRIQSTWRPNIVDNGHNRPWLQVNEKGWMDSSVYLQWLIKWEEGTRTYDADGELETRLLVFDGHITHVQIDAVRYARGHKVVMVKLPPHTTDLLQPSDVSVMKPLKEAWSKLLTARLRRSRNPLSMVEFIEGIAKMYPRPAPRRQLSMVSGARASFPRTPIATPKIDLTHICSEIMTRGCWKAVTRPH